MALNIESDRNRFKHIVRGRVRRDLKKFMSSGELVGRKGKDTISIPLPQIDLPRFKYGKNEEKGVGAGEGEEGEPIGQGEGEDGAGEAGDQPGQHVLEVDITLEELAEIMAEELELPKIEPKGQAKLEAQKDKYTGIRGVGPRACATSSGPTAGRSNARSPRAATTPRTRSWCRSTRTSSTAPGRPSTSRSATRWSST